ncbi:MAG: BACON domain-containing protein [Bacteroidaceae bacterium]|nr:BACON domain-containing protein [Bacteroidaceae bacterium]
MKSTFTKISLCLALITATMTSCLNGENEYHEIYFYPQRPEGIVFYADQTTDTTTLVSYDSWTMTKEGEWFDASPNSQEIPVGSYGITRIGISTTPNTTGQNRSGRISINSYLSISTPIYQAAWLNITSPRPKYTNTDTNGSFNSLKARFELELLTNATSTSVHFYTYGKSATLTSDAEWLKPQISTYMTGAQMALINVEPNETSTARQAQLSLTSEGVTTIIYVKQEGKKKI